MPVIPIKDLKDTAKISRMCHATDDPIQVTKNGYEDLVIVSPEVWRNAQACMDREALYREIARGERDVAEGNLVDDDALVAKLEAKYAL